MNIFLVSHSLSNNIGCLSVLITDVTHNSEHGEVSSTVVNMIKEVTYNDIYFQQKLL